MLLCPKFFQRLANEWLLYGAQLKSREAQHTVVLAELSFSFSYHMQIQIQVTKRKTVFTDSPLFNSYWLENQTLQNPQKGSKKCLQNNQSGFSTQKQTKGRKWKKKRQLYLLSPRCLQLHSAETKTNTKTRSLCVAELPPRGNVPLQPFCLAPRPSLGATTLSSRRARTHPMNSRWLKEVGQGRRAAVLHSPAREHMEPPSAGKAECEKHRRQNAERHRHLDALWWHMDSSEALIRRMVRFSPLAGSSIEALKTCPGKAEAFSVMFFFKWDKNRRSGSSVEGSRRKYCFLCFSSCCRCPTFSRTIHFHVSVCVCVQVVL